MRFGMVRARDVASLVDEREREPAQLGGPLLGNLDAAGVGGDDRRLVHRHVAAHVVDQHGHGGQMVDRAIEKALLLRGMQVDGDQTIRSRGAEQVEHQAGGDRLAALMFLVLTGVAEERCHDGDGLGGGALEGIDHQQLLHHPLVDRVGVALQHEHVGASNRLREPHIHLTVGEIVCGGGQHVDAEILSHFIGKLRICAARHQGQSLIGCALKDRRHVFPLFPSIVSLPFTVVIRCRTQTLSNIQEPAVPRGTAGCDAHGFFHLRHGARSRCPVPGEIIPISRRPA